VCVCWGEVVTEGVGGWGWQGEGGWQEDGGWISYALTFIVTA